MEQYISKSALVAEIERRRNDYINSLMIEQVHTLSDVLDFLNTLEVKEVDINKEISQFIDANFEKATIGHKLSLRRTAKHFFELGFKAKDWKKERMEECSYRQVGCTMYEDKILECNGACSWVVDYPKLKELKAQEGE